MDVQKIFNRSLFTRKPKTLTQGLAAAGALAALVSAPVLAQPSTARLAAAAAELGQQAELAPGVPQELLDVYSAPGESSGVEKILVRFADGLSEDAIQAVIGSAGTAAKAAGLPAVDTVRGARSGKFHVLQVPAHEKSGSWIETLRAQPEVVWAEANGVMSGHLVPNEVFYDNFNGVATDLQKWYFAGIGSDPNINAEAAWDQQTGRADVVVAIIDSGTDWFYTDLFENLVTNAGEIPGDGIDNDGNGFVDDQIGWDFVDNDNDATAFPWGDGIDNDGDGVADDGVFHGTFVASTAVGVGNNGANALGACWNCGLIPVRALDDENNGSFEGIADAIFYAVDRGASVINLSLGGGFSFAVFDAVSYARRNNVVVVASAGNGNTSTPQYPASLGGVIGVGATDSGSVLLGGSGDIDGRASFSNWGSNALVVAPGVHLIGLRPGSVAQGTAGTATIGSSNGTSFSAPLVAGLAGLVLSEGLDGGEHFRWSLVYGIILSTTVDLPDDPGDSPDAGSSWDGSGRVDFVEALELANLLAW